MDEKYLEYRRHNAAARPERKQSGTWHYTAQKKQSDDRPYG